MLGAQGGGGKPGTVTLDSLPTRTGTDGTGIIIILIPLQDISSLVDSGVSYPSLFCTLAAKAPCHRKRETNFASTASIRYPESIRSLLLSPLRHYHQVTQSSNQSISPVIPPLQIQVNRSSFTQIATDCQPVVAHPGGQHGS